MEADLMKNIKQQIESEAENWMNHYMQYAAFKLSTTLYYFSVSNSGELAHLGAILGIIGGVTFAVLFIAKIFKTISLAVSEGIKSASKK